MGSGNSSGNEQCDITAIQPREIGMECADYKREQPFKKAAKATATELASMLERQQYCCAMSGLPLTPETAELDHIVPVSDGGSHMIDNLQWLHVEVNRMKGSLSQKRFEQIVKLIAERVDNASGSPCGQ